MGKRVSEQQGKYCYAFIGHSGDRNYGPIGIAGADVFTIPQGEISAVVSDVPDERIRPIRQNLAAHQAVLKRLMEETTPLPVAFGIIADGTKFLKDMLLSQQKEFLRQLRRVTGKVEMGLRVTWDVPNIFDYFVSTHSELRSARDRYFGVHREPTQEEKIELGRMFDRLLSEDREDHTSQIEEILTGYCCEIKRNKCRTEQEVMNLASLVDKAKINRFEEGIFEAASRFDNSFAFDYSGPWAPHNFVDISIQL